MSYALTKRGSFHGEETYDQRVVSFHGLGASSGGDVEIDYYAAASQLRWKSASWKSIHDDLVGLDEDWHEALHALPLDLIPDAALRTAVTSMIDFPMPIAAEIALALEVLGGNRPFDESCVQMLAFARDRLFSNAGGLAAISTTSGAIAACLAFLGPADLGISAASVASFAGITGLSSAVIAGLGGIMAALADGKKPKQSDLDLMLAGAGAVTGNAPPSKDSQAAAVAALADRQEQDQNASTRRARVNSAKARALRKKDTCRARGGVFDASAPDGCRVPNSRSVADNLKSAGIDVPGGDSDSSSGKTIAVVGGLAALGVVGVWLIARKPRKNPNPPRRRRRRRS